MKYLKIIFIGIYFFLIGLIFTFAASPATTSTATSDKTTEIVIETYDFITPTKESVTERHPIDEIKNFVRKAIGHFGLFLVLGIFGTLSLIFILDNKYIILFIILISGISVAAISEILQIYAEARGPAIKDVLLDYSGYLISALIIYLIYILTKGSKKYAK